MLYHIRFHERMNTKLIKHITMIQEGALCALDVLSASGLINYFGRMELPGSATDAAEALETGLHVKPVLLQKGTTKLALYGMGNIRDERFHYEMQSNRMSLFRPAEDPEDWFNVLLVHQNRFVPPSNRSVRRESNVLSTEYHMDSRTTLLILPLVTTLI